MSDSNSTASKAAEYSQKARWYVREADIERYGSFANHSIGTFAPGLNIVYGANEAGKSTLASFIAGVLFGWPLSRGRRNGYRPQTGDRAGSLVFANGRGETARVSRWRNTDGLQGDAQLVSDIDGDTYHTLFALDSDALRSLDNSATVTSRLLTAGTGTDESPADIRDELQERIDRCWSRAKANEHSLVHLQANLKHAEADVAGAREQSERFFQLQQEYEALQREKVESDGLLERSTSTVERVKGQLVLLEDLERRRDDCLVGANKLQNRLDAEAGVVSDSAGKAADARESDETHSDSALSSRRKNEMSQSKPADCGQHADAEKARIDALYEKQVRLEQDLLTAQHNLANDKQRDAVLQQDDAFLKAAAHAQRTRKLQVVLSFMLPVIALLIGIPFLAYGQSVASMTITAFGVALIVAAVFMAIAAIIAVLKPGQSDDRTAQKRSDAQWIVQRGEQRVRECQKALDEFNEYARSILQQMGFKTDVSLAQAIEALDSASASIGAEDTAKSTLQQMHQRLTDMRSQAESLQQRIEGVLADAGAQDAAALDDLIVQLEKERDRLRSEQSELARRLGQLEQVLSDAKRNVNLTAARQQAENARELLQQGEREYARLLLAHRMLTEAIQQWEKESQPRVYRRAGALLSDMTEGSWQRVRLTESQELEVVDAAGRTLPPFKLSLGTRQQLYLSLRIALLFTADDVGRNVPVLADDILVHFDDARRVAAMKALLQLANQRQVILLTGHKETVDLARLLDASVNVVTLP